MSVEFKIAETENFIKKIKHRDYNAAYHKIINYVYPQLKKNPFFGPNIKKLKGEFSGLYRYRTGNFNRIFYSIEIDRIIIFIIDIEKRKDSYKKR